MYQEKFVVDKSEVDVNGEIKISRLMLHAQDVAVEHARRLKIDRDVLMKDNNIWVVVRTDIKINRLPKLKEKYFLSTHPGETKGFMFPRYFQVYDKHKNLLVSISSTWVIVNFDTRKIALHPLKDVVLPFERSPDDLELPPKINDEASNVVLERLTKESELDINLHINNTFYYDYVLDVHDDSFYKENRVTRLTLNYEKEIIHPNKIVIFSNKNNPEVLVGKVNDNISFASKVEYTKR